MNWPPARMIQLMVKPESIQIDKDKQRETPTKHKSMLSLMEINYTELVDLNELLLNINSL